MHRPAHDMFDEALLAAIGQARSMAARGAGRGALCPRARHFAPAPTYKESTPMGCAGVYREAFALFSAATNRGRSPERAGDRRGGLGLGLAATG